MALVKEKYSVDCINRIHQLLKNEAEKGVAKEYDIKVDEFKVVSRNNDPERFFEHEQFLLPSSKHIAINIYDGSSPRCTRYMLLLAEEEPSKQELSGIEKSINARMAQEKRNWEYDRLKKENEQLRNELEDSSKYERKLERIISELKAEKLAMPAKFTDAIVSIAGLLISDDKKGLQGLLGKQPDATGNEEHERETECTGDEGMGCTFERVDDNPLQYTGKAEQSDFDRFDNALIPLFPEEHREKVSTIASILYHNHHIIDEIEGLLADSVKQTGKKAA